MLIPRVKWFKLAFGGMLLMFTTILVTEQFSVFKIRELNARISELEREKAEMLRYAQRITASRRVAQVNVVDQQAGDDGVTHSVLHWQQISPSGVLGPVEVLDLKGDQVYFEAMVVKFEYDLIGRETPGKSTNLALFRRAFGSDQAPSSGHPLDQTAPSVEGGKRSENSADRFAWARFYDVVSHPELAKEFGIRIAQCEAPSVPVKKGQVWEVTLDAAGGLNLKYLGEQSNQAGARVPAPAGSELH